MVSIEETLSEFAGIFVLNRAEWSNIASDDAPLCGYLTNWSIDCSIAVCMSV